MDPTSRLLPVIVTIVFPCRGPNVGPIEYTIGTCTNCNRKKWIYFKRATKQFREVSVLFRKLKYEIVKNL